MYRGERLVRKFDKKTLLKRELQAILDLATCDDTLFNDGINEEIEYHAKKGLDLICNLQVKEK